MGQGFDKNFAFLPAQQRRGGVLVAAATICRARCKIIIHRLKGNDQMGHHHGK